MSISPGTMTVGILAIVAGLVGAYTVRTALLAEQVVEVAPVVTTVPLAATDLPAGRTLSLGDISLIEITAEELDRRELPMTLVMADPQQIIGRTLETATKRGEPFLTTSMYLEGTGPDISKKLKPGFRAFTLEIPKVLAGNVVEGTIIDVILRTDARDASETELAIPETTLTLVQGVEVLNVEHPQPVVATAVTDTRYINNTAPRKRSPVITLAVTLEQANALRAVEGRGDLSLVARAADDSQVVAGGSAPVTLESLLGITADTTTFVTEAYRGGSRDQNTFRGNFRTSQPPVTADRDVAVAISTGGKTLKSDTRQETAN